MSERQSRQAEAPPTKEEPVERKAASDVETRTVRSVAAGGYSLPSGAQYLLQPGDELTLNTKDAQFLLDNGLAE